MFGSILPGLIGVIGSLFGGGKGKPTSYVNMLPPQGQQAWSGLLNYLMQNYQKQAPGQYGANMGMYTLMNKFYPGQMQMPTQQPQTNPYAALLSGRQPMAPQGQFGQGMMGQQ